MQFHQCRASTQFIILMFYNQDATLGEYRINDKIHRKPVPIFIIQGSSNRSSYTLRIGFLFQYEIENTVSVSFELIVCCKLCFYYR
jgi:hypothetical protein